MPFTDRTVPLKKRLARPYRFILLGVTQYYCYTRSEYRAESSFKWIFLLCLYHCCSSRLFLTQPFRSSLSICFCSSRRLIASLLARFALVRQRNCSCSYSHQFRFSPSIVYALLLARSASVRRLFLLFSSINSFSSRQVCSSPSIVSAVLSPVPLQSVDCFCSSSRPFSFSPSIVYALLVY